MPEDATSGVEGSSGTAKSTTKLKFRAGKSSVLSRHRSPRVLPTKSLNAPSPRPPRTISFVNYGANAGWEPTYQALFKTPFFKRITQSLSAVEDRGARVTRAQEMGARIVEELERFASMKAWNE